MKKAIFYIIGFIIIVFILPVIFTTSPKSQETIAQEENQKQDTEEKNIKTEDMNPYYLKYQKIKLLHTESGEIEELDMNEYLYGVVSAEMPASYEKEALKAQAIVARTYTIYQAMNNGSKHENADICDDYACCQAWISKKDRFAKWNENEAESNWQKIVECVDNTTGKIILYDEKPINAFFHSNSGGVTETSLNIWGGIDYPYLKSVETSGEDGYNQYSSEVVLSKEELINKMKEKYSDFEIDFNTEECIKILELTSSNRVKTIKIGNKEIAGTEARSIFGLKSTNFTFEINGENIKFSVKGYGHGVGMSQTGADSMAKTGANYEEIIKHFYTDVEIK